MDNTPKPFNLKDAIAEFKRALRDLLEVMVIFGLQATVEVLTTICLWMKTERVVPILGKIEQGDLVLRLISVLILTALVFNHL